MKSILVPLLAALLLASAAHADLFIYRGVLKTSSDTNTANLFSKLLNTDVVVDYDGSHYGVLIFGHLAGGRHFLQSATNKANFASAPLPLGHTASLFVSGNTADTTPVLFSDMTTLFRGTNTTLFLRSIPAHTFASRPGTLKGTIISGGNGIGGGSFSEQHLGLSFQGAATIKANNANQSIDDVLNSLAAGLMAKGFTPP